MKINKPLLEKQIKTLSKQLDKKLTNTERLHIEGLLNFLGDFAEMMKGPREPAPKIMIQVDGGNISAVYANRQDVKIVIIDNDNIKDGQNPLASIQSPDAVRENMYDFYLHENATKDEQRICTMLQTLNF